MRVSTSGQQGGSNDDHPQNSNQLFENLYTLLVEIKTRLDRQVKQDL
jgi:hypothetical protein